MKHLVVPVVLSVLTTSASVANAQSSKDLAGAYILAAETREQNGQKTDVPVKGSLSLDASGRYMLMTMRPDLPKIASGNRMTATPEENKAIVGGVVAHFGTYTVADNNLVFRIELASFPNWNGVEQKRAFTLNGDELKYTLATASGGGSVTLTWKRVK